MKRTAILSTIFSFLFSVGSFANFDNSERYLSIEDAMLNPHLVAALELDLNEQSVTKFYENVKSFKTLKALRVTDIEDKHQLKKFCNYAASISTLEHLELPIASAADLPSEITAMAHLKELHLIGEQLEGWVKNTRVQIDFVDDASGKSDFTMIIYNSEYISDKSISRLVKLYPDALVEQLEMQQQDFVYAPGKYQTVRPPIPGIDVPKTEYPVNAETGSELYYESGTVVHIPENAFVDDQGNLIEGEVLVNYREFSDQAEIMASGIPMNYDSAGVNNWFTSAGMFEITATSEGQEVFMNANANVEVDLATTDQAQDFSLYILDEETGEWRYERSDINTVITSDVMPLSNAWKSYAVQNGNKLMELEFDAMTFDERWQSDDYSYIYRKDEDHSEQIYSLPGKMIVGSSSVDWEVEPKINIELTAQKETVNGTITFTVDASEKTHPELRAFNNVVWEYQGEMSRSEFKKEFIKQQAFLDIRFTYNCAEEAFTMELKDQDGRVTLNAKLQFRTKILGEEEQLAEMQKRERRYNISMERKQRAFDREIVRNEKKFKRQQDHAWFSLSLQMSDEEKKMTRRAWLEYCDVMCDKYDFMLDNSDVDMMETYKMMESDRASNRRIAARNIRRRARTGRPTRSISINIFGLINCDKTFRAVEQRPQLASTNSAGDLDANRPVKVSASFKGRGGQRMDVSSVFVLTKGHNGVLRFDMQKDQSELEIMFNPTMETTIVAVDVQGNLSVLRPKAVERLTIGRDHVESNVLEMKILKKKFAGIDDLRKAL